MKISKQWELANKDQKGKLIKASNHAFKRKIMQERK